MLNLSPQTFFSLEKYAHAKIFEKCSFVWEALLFLPAYIESQLLGKIEVEIPLTAHLINPSLISIGKGTIVEPGAFIQGPCIIGQNCVIRHGAYLRGNVLSGDNCVIGHDTEVKNSIFLNRANAPHFNYVGDSILGSDVNLGAGVKLANFRLDQKEISVLFKGQKIFTKLKKFGAILGDGSSLGCNAVTNPGTLIGPKAFCYPCLNLGGIIPSETIVRK